MEHGFDFNKRIVFRSRTIDAQAKQIHNEHMVFVLKLPSTPILGWALTWIPRCLRQQLARTFPEWFLPPIVILKEKSSDPDKRGKHDHEKLIYQQLSPLQGQCVPRFYGEAFRDGNVPALLLEYVEGTTLNNLGLEELGSPQALEALKKGYWAQKPSLGDHPHPGLLLALQKMYNKLTANGVVHGDSYLHNFILVGEEVAAVDFERSHFLPSDITNDMELRVLMEEIEEMFEAAAGEPPIVQTRNPPAPERREFVR